MPGVTGFSFSQTRTEPYAFKTPHQVISSQHVFVNSSNRYCNTYRIIPIKINYQFDRSMLSDDHTHIKPLCMGYFLDPKEKSDSKQMYGKGGREGWKGRVGGKGWRYRRAVTAPLLQSGLSVILWNADSPGVTDHQGRGGKGREIT